MKHIFSQQQIDAIRAKDANLVERSSAGVQVLDEANGVITIKATGLVEGILNNYRELNISSAWTASLANEIIINPEHSREFEKVLDFAGKGSIGSKLLTREDIIAAFGKNSATELIGSTVKTFDVTYEVREAEHPRMYELAKKKRLKYHSITSYDKQLLAVHPAVSWGSDEEHARFEEYKSLVLFPDVNKIPYFYIVTETNIAGLSPVLFPSQRLALSSVIAERMASMTEEQVKEEISLASTENLWSTFVALASK